MLPARCCRFVFLPTFISGLVYFSLKRGCYAKSRTRISCECVILQLLPGCFCDLDNNERNINKQQLSSLEGSLGAARAGFQGEESTPSLSSFLPTPPGHKLHQAQELDGEGRGRSWSPSPKMFVPPEGQSPPTAVLLILPSTKANKSLA